MKPPRVPKGKAPAPAQPHVSYRGHLLIAMPGLNAPPFDHSVIYLCQHDAEHAMGLILAQAELALQNLDDEFARREIVVEQNDLVKLRLLDLDLRFGGQLRVAHGAPPSAMAWKRRRSASATGPGRPSPIGRPSIATTGMTIVVALERNASRAA